MNDPQFYKTTVDPALLQEVFNGSAGDRFLTQDGATFLRYDSLRFSTEGEIAVVQFVYKDLVQASVRMPLGHVQATAPNTVSFKLPLPALVPWEVRS